MPMDLVIDLTTNTRLVSDVLKIAGEACEEAADREELLREDLFEAREKIRLLESAGKLAAESFQRVHEALAGENEIQLDRIMKLEEDLDRKTGMTMVLMADLKHRTSERDEALFKLATMKESRP